MSETITVNRHVATIRVFVDRISNGCEPDVARAFTLPRED
jgi:hypothetical protein